MQLDSYSSRTKLVKAMITYTSALFYLLIISLRFIIMRYTVKIQRSILTWQSFFVVSYMYLNVEAFVVIEKNT